MESKFQKKQRKISEEVGHGTALEYDPRQAGGDDAGNGTKVRLV